LLNLKRFCGVPLPLDQVKETLMDLSIIVVNWNTKELLQDCLRSAWEGLDGIKGEIIVIDNASTDGSVGMVREDFPGTQLIANSENRGFAAANNQGFALARGRHILLLNSDTVVHDDVFARSVQYLDENPDVGMMGCRVLNGDGSTQMTCSQFPEAAFSAATRCWTGTAMMNEK
jgi:GT2 family glycosyltransferase